MINTTSQYRDTSTGAHQILSFYKSTRSRSKPHPTPSPKPPSHPSRNLPLEPATCTRGRRDRAYTRYPVHVHVSGMRNLEQPAETLSGSKDVGIDLALTYNINKHHIKDTNRNTTATCDTRSEPNQQNIHSPDPHVNRALRSCCSRVSLSSCNCTVRNRDSHWTKTCLSAHFGMVSNVPSRFSSFLRCRDTHVLDAFLKGTLRVYFPT